MFEVGDMGTYVADSIHLEEVTPHVMAEEVVEIFGAVVSIGVPSMIRS